MKFAEENIVIKRPFQYDSNDKENIDTSNIIDLEVINQYLYSQIFCCMKHSFCVAIFMPRTHSHSIL